MTDLDTLLANLNDDVPDMTDEAFAAGRARLRYVVDAGTLVTAPALDEDPVVYPLPAEVGRRSPPRRRTQLIAAAAALVAVAGAVLVMDAGRGTPASVSSPADLAEWAAGLADDPPAYQPGQFRYVAEETRFATDLDHDPDFRTETRTRSELWAPYDYRDDWLHKRAPQVVLFVKGTAAEAVAAGHVPPRGLASETLVLPCGATTLDPSVEPPPCPRDGWLGVGSPEFFESLPDDPRDLYDMLRERAGDGGFGPLPHFFTEAERLLQPATPNSVRATLFQAMSELPELVVTDGALTSDGRPGIGLRITQNGATEQWIIDRKTGDHLELKEIAGGQEHTRTYHWNVVDELGAVPAK